MRFLPRVNAQLFSPLQPLLLRSRASSYTEAAGQKVMNQQEIIVTVILGRGELEQQVLTCDFSYDYVRINAEYRT
jgi:glutamate N-acetyltransferase/amino-acid N-acetyltransferase